MSALAEDSLEGPTWGKRARNLLLGGLLLAAVLAGGWWLAQNISKPSNQARQVARIVLLPDAPPPPPPPPPREEKRPEPKPDNAQKAPQPKPDPAPPQAQQQLREEGPTSDRAGGIAGGTVTREGVPAAPVIGGPTTSGTGSLADRAQERFYANSARQLLRDALERHLKSDATRLRADFSVWLAADGAIQRYELAPSGDSRVDAELRAALDDTARSLKLPPPPPIVQPMRFRLTVQPLG